MCLIHIIYVCLCVRNSLHYTPSVFIALSQLPVSHDVFRPIF